MVLGLVQECLDTGLGEAPSTRVKRLLLRPDDGLGVGVAVEVLLELLPREGVELLETRDGDIVNLVLGAVLVQSGVDLTRAEDDAVDLLAANKGAVLVSRVLNEGAELGVLTGEVLDAGAGERVAEERLGEENDKGYMISRVKFTKEREDLRLRNWRCIWRRRAWNKLAGSVK